MIYDAEDDLPIKKLHRKDIKKILNVESDVLVFTTWLKFSDIVLKLLCLHILCNFVIRARLSVILAKSYTLELPFFETLS